jgi:membrane protein
MAKLVERGREIVTAAIDDNIMGEAAKVSFYFFLALFPLIMVVFTLTGLIGGDRIFAWAMTELERAAPEDAAVYLEQFIRQITHAQRPGLFSIGLLLTLWASSNIFVGLADGLNSMYNIRERRSFIRMRLIALGQLIASIVTLFGSAFLILLGPQIVQYLGLGFTWQILRWPLVFLLVVVQLWMIYFVLPNRDQRGAKQETLIGAVVGAVLWLIATALFQLYVANFGAYEETYGVIGGIIVLMLWMYITAMMILFGGEVAAHLEDDSSARNRGGRSRQAA